VARTDPASMFAWPEDLGTGYHYEAAHGRDAFTAYLPALYLDNHGIMGVFAASLDAVREILPSDDLHPVRLDRRHAAVAVGAFLYERWWCRAEGHGVLRGDPYAEIVVAPLCTFGASAPPMVPLLGLPLPARWRMGMFVQHMPVTHWVASEAGRKIGNFPKFVADVDWVRDAEGTTCRLAEGGHDILDLAVRGTGTIRALQDPIRSFTVQDGRLFRHEMPASAAAKVTRSPGTARLRLGDHPVADDLRALGIDERSVGAYHYLAFSIRLEEPVDLGPCRSHDGFRGVDRGHGRLTVTYFDSEPVDLYATQPTRPGWAGTAA
jgi:hypothetical protein